MQHIISAMVWMRWTGGVDQTVGAQLRTWHSSSLSTAFFAAGSSSCRTTRAFQASSTEQSCMHHAWSERSTYLYRPHLTWTEHERSEHVDCISKLHLWG